MSNNDYRWDSQKRAVLYRTVHAAELFPDNAGAIFAPLAGELGVNLYGCSEQRDLAMQKQQNAHIRGHALKVGDSFQLDWNNIFVTQPDGYYAEFRRIMLYGYITGRSAESGPPENPDVSCMMDDMLSEDSFLWDSRNETLFYQKVHETEHLPNGAKFIFVTISEGIGVKLCYYNDQRDYAMKNQANVFNHGLAPKVGDSFQLDWNNIFAIHPAGSPPKFTRLTLYGYITQRAITGRSFTESQVSHLNGLLQNLGAASEFDDNDGNFGYINNKLVCLDFDEGSWT